MQNADPRGHAAQRRDEQPHRRALQRLRRDARQALRHGERGTRPLRDPRRRRARHRRAHRDLRPDPVRRARARRRGRHRGRLPRRRQPRDLRHDLDRHRHRVHDVRRADVPTARAAHELARRHPHRARVVRAGVRGARLPGLDRRPARRRRPRRARRDASSSTTCGSGIRPAIRCRSRRWRRRARRAATSRASGSCATSRCASSPARPSRSSGRRAPGKTTIAMLVPRIYDVTQGAVRVDGHDVQGPHARVAARGGRSRAAGSAPLPREHPRQHALRRARRDRRRPRGRAARRRASGISSSRCPTGSTRWSANAATACRAARSNASRSRDCC